MPKLISKKINSEGDLKQINALLEISKAIASGLYLEDILRLIVTVTANVMNSKICSLWILDEKENRLKLRATQSISSEYLKERSLGLGEGVVGHVALHNKPMVILDVLKDPLYKEKELAKKEGLVSMLSVPMCIKDRVVGVINCYTSFPHSFSKMEEELLSTIANQAAICIENSGLMESLDIDEILKSVLEGVTKTGFDRARLYLIDEKRHCLECKMAVGVDEDAIKGINLPLDRDDSILARSVMEKRPFIIQDARKDPRVNQTLKEKFNLKSLIVIPIITKERVLGAISADHITPGKKISKEAFESVIALSQQASLAIHHAFRYKELKELSQKMEERIKKAQDELKKTEMELFRSEKLAALGQLAAGFAHEIRNPLTSINLLIQSLIEKLPNKGSYREDLSIIEEEILRINEIIDQFLKFAKPSKPVFEKTEIIPILEEVLQLLKIQIEKQKVTVKREFSALPPIIIDKEQIKQVFFNLILNAIQAMPHGGELKLETRLSEDGKFVKLQFKDSGIGIPHENMARLFDPFYTTKDNGIGLGLSIVHRIIDQHQGRIEVDSTLGKGTLFTIWLPMNNDLTGK